MTSTQHFQPPAGTLPIDTEMVCLCLGYTREVPAAIRQQVLEMAGEAAGRMRMECGYSLHPAVIHKDRFEASGETFACGRIIGAGLKGSTSAALCVSTVGEDMDRWSRALFAEGDPLAGLIADTIGSVAVDAVAAWLAERIAEQAGAERLQVTNHYSPGYCDWHVAEQRRLFSLLPSGFCGVRLTESALMVPLKSISGVIGLGETARKLEYNCKACDLDECIYRNARMRKEAAV
jgi:hypothetical protein